MLRMISMLFIVTVVLGWTTFLRPTRLAFMIISVMIIAFVFGDNSGKQISIFVVGVFHCTSKYDYILIDCMPSLGIGISLFHDSGGWRSSPCAALFLHISPDWLIN